MKYIILFFFLNFFVMADDDLYKVLKVVDGDTLYIDFNSNNKIEQKEKVRIAGIDAFETRVDFRLKKQAKNSGISDYEALKLGYLGKKFAQKKLLYKKVKIEYPEENKNDKYNRKLVSIYFDGCEYPKSYEKEILKEGLARVYLKSNQANDLEDYENLEKIRENALKTRKLNLVILNRSNNKYHEINCKYINQINYAQLIERPVFNFKYKPAKCCAKKGNNFFKVLLDRIILFFESIRI